MLPSRPASSALCSVCVARVVERRRQASGVHFQPCSASSLASWRARRAIRAAAGTRRTARGTRRRACGARASARELRVEELPQRDQRQEIRALVAEPQVRLVGRLLLRERPLARIGHRQRARDDQHFGEAAAVARGEHDAADARIERQARELAPERRQLRARVDRAQLLQQLVAVGDRARRRRLEERKRVDVAERRAPPCAGSPTRASCAGSRDRCTAAARAKSSSPYRRTQMPSGDAAAAAGALVAPRPARSSRSAAASSCCARCSA